VFSYPNISVNITNYSEYKKCFLFFFKYGPATLSYEPIEWYAQVHYKQPFISPTVHGTYAYE
jgi:hypothetical protein